LSFPYHSFKVIITPVKTPRTKKQTYYKILGVSSDVSAEEIKKAYIKLARKYHPDRKPDDKRAQARFAGIAEAYQTLSNSGSRYAYDLELGIEPGEKVVSTYERIEQASLTGTASGDYVESLTSGIAVPTLRKMDEETYEFRGLDNPKIRAAYDKGLFSIGMLKRADMHHYHELGMKSLREKKFDEAVACCITAVRINPRNMHFRFSLGCCFEAKGFLKEAIEEYEQTLSLGTDKSYTCLPVREALISLYLKLKQFPDVKRHCKSVWELGLTSAIAERALYMVRHAERSKKK
jgi:tetratricopeptide (TPR) repeat protein